MDELKLQLKNYLYYVIIAVMSLGVLIIFPFLGSSADVGWAFPSTSAGWFIWAFEKISVTGINICLFTSFKKQGKLNIKDDTTYQNALKSLSVARKTKKYIPISPTKYQVNSYAKKGSTMIASTLLSLMAIGNMILKFNYISLISYGITIVMGIIFGVFVMKDDELYWTTEFPLWVESKLKETDNDL